MKNIYKYFGDFCALDDVSLKVQKGTIHALLGENGAGKSTLMNILYGFYNSDGGEIFVNEEKVNIKNPSSAINLGIGMVHQHFMLVETLTVLQNIILGSEVTNRLGILNMKKARKEIMEISEKYGLAIDPDALISNISVGMQQRVEILKTLYRGADILILDEPTAVLTPQEISELINIMQNLIKDDKTIIIITHKLKEIKESSDFCTVIRRGKYIDTVEVKDVSEQGLASMMVGRDVNLHIDRGECDPKGIVFEVKGLTVADYRGLDKVKDFNIKVRSGEIVGIAGIEGNGQKELVEAIMCLAHTKAGNVLINGKEIQNTNPKNVLESGVSVIHEDRHKRGLILDYSVELNTVTQKFKKKPFSKKGILNFEEINNYAKKLIGQFDVRPDDCEKTPIRALSGGNQQKLIIARQVSEDFEIIIAVQPTRGLDVGAIEFVHKELVRQRNAGKAVLLISLELEEIMDLSDSIGVIYDGKIVNFFENDGKVSEQEIGLMMAGGGKNE
ncbi:MAG: ABC transporter ATP-binding protein [Defluviitaleaceae bacterium]|nr:ABC transporter ATP-binding protein [Defluviitaleaceae bacterium]